MTRRQQLYQARVSSIRLCSCRRVLHRATSIRLSLCCLLSHVPRQGGRLYRFPIGGLSSWSLGRGGEDSHLIYSPPPELGSGTRTCWPIWNYLPRARLCVSVARAFEWCSLQPASVCVNERCRRLQVSRRRTLRRRSLSSIRLSEACCDTWLSLFDGERCSDARWFMWKTLQWRLQHNNKFEKSEKQPWTLFSGDTCKT